MASSMRNYYEKDFFCLGINIEWYLEVNDTSGDRNILNVTYSTNNYYTLCPRTDVNDNPAKYRIRVRIYQMSGSTPQASLRDIVSNIKYLQIGSFRNYSSASRWLHENPASGYQTLNINYNNSTLMNNLTSTECIVTTPWYSIDQIFSPYKFPGGTSTSPLRTTFFCLKFIYYNPKTYTRWNTLSTPPGYNTTSLSSQSLHTLSTHSFITNEEIYLRSTSSEVNSTIVTTGTQPLRICEAKLSEDSRLEINWNLNDNKVIKKYVGFPYGIGSFYNQKNVPFKYNGNINAGSSPNRSWLKLYIIHSKDKNWVTKTKAGKNFSNMTYLKALGWDRSAYDDYDTLYKRRPDYFEYLTSAGNYYDKIAYPYGSINTYKYYESQSWSKGKYKNSPLYFALNQLENMEYFKLVLYLVDRCEEDVTATRSNRWWYSEVYQKKEFDLQKPKILNVPYAENSNSFLQESRYPYQWYETSGNKLPTDKFTDSIYREWRKSFVVECPEDYIDYFNKITMTLSVSAWQNGTDEKPASGFFDTREYKLTPVKICISDIKYKVKKDSNNKVILDNSDKHHPKATLEMSNGKPIVEQEAIYKYFYVYNGNMTPHLLGGDTRYFAFNVYVSAKNYETLESDDGIILYREPDFKFPSIFYRTLSGLTGELTGTSVFFNEDVQIYFDENDKDFEDQQLIINDDYVDNKTWVQLNGSYKVTIYGTRVRNLNRAGLHQYYNMKERVYKDERFTVDTSEVPAIVISGVSDGQEDLKYTISVIKESNVTYSIWYVNEKDEIIYPKLTVRQRSDGKEEYIFTVSTIGLYDLFVKAVHNKSMKEKYAQVNRWRVLEVIESSGSSNFGNIKNYFPEDFTSTNNANITQPDKYYLYSRVCLDPANDRSITTYNVKEIDSVYRRYLAPLLIIDSPHKSNYNFNARETYKNQTISTYSTQFTTKTIIPPLPEIRGVQPNKLYYNPVTITFSDNGLFSSTAEEERSGYVIFIDGVRLEREGGKNYRADESKLDPFNTAITVSDYGNHFVFIICYDNIRPTSYRTYGFKFIIKTRNDFKLRKPNIELLENSENGIAFFRVKFNCHHEVAEHVVLIEYIDGTSKTYKYPYDTNYSDVFRTNMDCVVTAESRIESPYVWADDKKCIIVKKGDFFNFDDFKIFGCVKKSIPDPETGTMIVENIAPGFVIDFPKNPYCKYEVYVNGLEYKEGTYITNRDEEIRKYKLEIIIEDTLNERKYYYSNSIIVDTISPAFPILMNFEEYNMNKKNFNFKDGEIMIKNDDTHNGMTSSYRNYIDYRFSEKNIMDVKSFIFKQDDEYILSLTYLYYNGVKRTASYYFSINSEFLNEYMDINDKNYKLDSEMTDFRSEDISNFERYFRIILKTLDYNHSNVNEIAEDGELVIDRRNGHLWYKKNGMFELTPITKDIEDIIYDVEKHLYNTEEYQLAFNYMEEVANQIINHYQDKMNNFLDKLNKFKQEVDELIAKIDELIRLTDLLEEDMIDYQNNCNNNPTLNNSSSNIQSLIDKIDTITNDFTNFNNKLIPDLFNRAAIVRDETIELKFQINRCVSYDEFEDWLFRENEKYENFKKRLEIVYGY